MKTLNKMRFIPLLLTLSVVVMMAVVLMNKITIAAQPAINLGTTSGFAVLAGSTVTNTGTSTVNGDIGLSPGLAVTGFPPGILNGTIHVSDAAANQAQSDLITAYDTVAGQPVTATLAEDLGGQTLVPGVYNSLTGKFTITGTLTLDGGNNPNAIFIFKTDETLITANSSIVNLINGTQPFNVYWKVGSSATLGTSSDFKGNILALTSITATTAATVNGRLLARNGAVTLDTNNITITKPATLNIIKHVVNDNGGTAIAANFNVHLSGNSIAADAPGAESPGTSYILAAGTYVVSEDVFAGYTGSFSGDSTDGNIILAPGDNKTITITNNDVPLPLINVTKTPAPLALPSGQGAVTYTYKVTNPGVVALSNVSVTDDKISLVTYVSGDVNADNLLQTGETWIYTGEKYLYETMTNTATAKGSANDKTATSIAVATVIVTPPVIVMPPVVITPPVPVYPPLINITKTPEPLALTSGQGWVTYTYKVTNPGKVALSNVIVTDDTVSPVDYVSGDLNADKLLQPNETWVYTSKSNLNKTTTNTATAKGSANAMTATDIAFATVVVTTPAEIVIPIVSFYPPLINITKTPEPLALISGQGSVTYTYKVTNLGMVELNNVKVTDDKVSIVDYVSGDVNSDNLLQSSETWVYISKSNLNATTTNTAMAEGNANGMVAIDYAFATVVVTTPPVVVKSTVSGGQIPDTATPWYNILFAGAVFTLFGAMGWWITRKKSYA